MLQDDKVQEIDFTGTSPITDYIFLDISFNLLFFAPLLFHSFTHFYFFLVIFPWKKSRHTDMINIVNLYHFIKSQCPWSHRLHKAFTFWPSPFDLHLLTFTLARCHIMLSCHSSVRSQWDLFVDDGRTHLTCPHSEGQTQSMTAVLRSREEVIGHWCVFDLLSSTLRPVSVPVDVVITTRASRTAARDVPGVLPSNI